MWCFAPCWPMRMSIQPLPGRSEEHTTPQNIPLCAPAQTGAECWFSVVTVTCYITPPIRCAASKRVAAASHLNVMPNRAGRFCDSAQPTQLRMDWNKSLCASHLSSRQCCPFPRLYRSREGVASHRPDRARCYAEFVRWGLNRITECCSDFACC